MSSLPDRRVVFSRDTLIPVGFGIAIVVGSVMADRRLSSLENSVESLRHDLSIVHTVTDAESLLRVRTFALWCDLFSAKNPSLTIPPIPR